MVKIWPKILENLSSVNSRVGPRPINYLHLWKHILVVTIGKYVEVAVPLRLHNRIAVFVAFSIAHHCMKSYAQCAQAFRIGYVCSL